MCAAASCLGNCHPPGYPLWILISNSLIRWVPFGEVAFRVNLASAFPMALASVFLGKCCERLANRRHVFALVVAALAAGLGRRAWFLAVTTEVHGLALLLWSIALYEGFRNEGKASCWVGLSIWAGLCLSNHQSSALLLLVLYLWTAVRCRGSCLRPGLVVRGGALGLLGLGVHLFLVIAASREPPANWGNPSTWSAFLDHLLRRQYGTVPALASNVWIYSMYVKAYARDLLTQWPVPVLGAAVGGVFLLDRSRIPLILSLFLVSSLLFLYLSGFDVAEWSPPISRLFFVPSFFFVSLCAGVGFSRFGSMAPRAFLEVGLFLLIPWLLLSSWVWNQRRVDDFARRYGWLCLRDMPREGVLFTAGDNVSFTCQHAIQVEGIREDVFLLSRIRLVSSEFRDLLRSKFPEWDFPSEEEVVRIQDLAETTETLPASSGSEEAPKWLEPLCERVVQGLPEGLSVGWELGGEQKLLMDRLDPVGLICQIRKGSGHPGEEVGLMARRDTFTSHLFSQGAAFCLNRDATFALATKFNEAGVLEASRDRLESALALYESALSINPRQATSLGNLAMTRKKLDPHAEVLPLFQGAIRNDPLNLALRWTYCSELVEGHHVEEARRGYEQILRLAPDLVGPWIGLYDLGVPAAAGHLMDRIQQDENAATFVSRWALTKERWEILELCARSWPSNPWIQRRWTQARSSLEPSLESLPSLREHVRRFPKDAMGWQLLGEELQRQGSLVEAREAYIMAFHQGSRKSARNVALCLVQEEELNGAEEWLRRALDQDGRDVESWVTLAAVWGRLGRMDDAEQACERALEVEPGHKNAWLNWALIQATQGKIEEAVSLLERALDQADEADRQDIYRDLERYRDLLMENLDQPMVE